MTNYPPTPAHLQPYVEVLGVEGAIELFLALGGSEVYLAGIAPTGESLIAERIGADRQMALAARIRYPKTRVPIPKRWIAHCMRATGLSTAEIGRRLHTTDSTIRRWLAKAPASSDGRKRPDPRQLTLF